MLDLTLTQGLEQPLARLLPGPSADQPTAYLSVRSTPAGLVVDGGSVAPVQAPDESEALDRLLERCNGTAVEQCRDVAVHAGVVARGNQVLAIPAESGTGKSTLVAALVQRGWSYVSDEALVLRPDGVVRPYAKWLSLHAWTLDRLGLEAPGPQRLERPVPVTELGHAVGADRDLRISHVVVPVRGLHTRLMPLGRAATASEVLRCCFNHYRDPAGTVRLVAEIITEAQCWELHLGDPVLAAELLSQLD